MYEIDQEIEYEISQKRRYLIFVSEELHSKIKKQSREVGIKMGKLIGIMIHKNIKRLSNNGIFEDSEPLYIIKQRRIEKGDKPICALITEESRNTLFRLSEKFQLTMQKIAIGFIKQETEMYEKSKEYTEQARNVTNQPLDQGSGV